MRGPPVVLTNTLGRPVTNVISERGAVPMVVVNTLGEPVTLVNSGGEPVTLFNPNGTLWDYPFSLFANAEQGAWYDPSDFSTLYQDSTGTTPVTAVEQPVGLMLDRSGRGNHALQATSASRPVLRARYNLLTFSEQFDNAGWTKGASSVTANAGVAPDGTTTADKLVENSATDFHSIRPTTSVGTIGATETLSVYAKAAERSWFVLQLGSNKTAYFNLSAGTIGTTASGTTATITALANGWYRCSIAGERVATQGNQIILASADNTASYTGDGTSGILIWGAQLLTAADQTSTGGAYQRIAAATDYDTSNPVFRPYLAFDGTDDILETSSIDMTATNKLSMFAGVTKLIDDAARFAASFGSTSSGSAELAVPRASGQNYAFTHRTNVVQEAIGLTGLAPDTVVLTGLSDIGAPSVQLRRNGVVAATTTSALNAANYGNYTLRIGARSAGANLFNGRLYSLAVLGRTATAAEIASMEAWVAGKTGVTL